MIEQLGWTTIGLSVILLLLIPATRKWMPEGWYPLLLLCLAAGIGMVVCA